MKFSELSKKETQKVIDDFVNELVKSFRVQNLTPEETLYISDRLIDMFNGKPIEIQKLTGRTKAEMLNSYKSYLPFCLASILTAYKKMSNG